MDGSTARTLARRLSAASDREIASLLAARRISPTGPLASGWRDFFDIAEALLDETAVRQALSTLSRDELADLTGPAGLDALALADDDGRPLPAVAEALGGRVFARADPADPPPASDEEAAHAAERAFTTLSSLADLLIGAHAAPLARVGSGSLGAAERRRLVEAGVASSPDEIDLLVRAARAIGLLRAEDRRILVTRSGAAWVRLATPDRWAELARRFRDALPAGLRTAEGGWIAPARWPDAYPLDETWPAKAAAWIEFARVLGLVGRCEEQSEPAWAAPLRRGDDPDPAPLVALLPPEVDRIFLQNDLTAISPGPLAAHHDVRLRGMAVRESHAQASTYRFTESSLARALQTGETAEGILSFLSEVSLTGVPQPLSYLVERQATRYGLVRVSLDPTTGHTVVSSPDHDLLRTIAVDQSLSALALVADDRLLRTRAPRDVVLWTLADARYPAIAIDEDGRPVTAPRHQVADDPQPASRYAELIARLRADSGAGDDRAWLERELDQAVRERAIVSVDVEMPGGEIRTLVLEATGIGGGRLRGRDPAADVERTLPISLIRALRLDG
ncbi:helicase-associated domain-containing protein [Microbacterium sp. gxy059]|uniref:helicase-associated domain-containing protein n=1 Tax=Microbacterium sp. gxy059 TaxID=2957199 RepID=UPI003D98E76D